jgi:hypothetical protein
LSRVITVSPCALRGLLYDVGKANGGQSPARLPAATLERGIVAGREIPFANHPAYNLIARVVSATRNNPRIKGKLEAIDRAG